VLSASERLKDCRFLAVDRFQRDDPNIGNQFRAAARLVRSMPLLISFHTGRHRFFPRSKMRRSLDGSAFRVNVPAPKPRLDLLHVIIDGSVLHQISPFGREFSKFWCETSSGTVETEQADSAPPPPS
jgi:hypothetical protein